MISVITARPQAIPKGGVDGAGQPCLRLSFFV
jgi:hypothetical protein